MASSAPSSSTTPTSKTPASHNTSETLQDRTNALQHNFMRVLYAVRDTIDGLRPYTEAAIKAAYVAWIAKLAGLPPPCKEHDGKRMSQLLKCSHCSPWAQALQQIVSAAGGNPKKKNWTAANLTPSTWPDPTLGPFAIAKAFVKARLTPDASIANADATCLLNILLHYPSVSQHLSPAAVCTNLEALQTVRNKGIGHWHKPELPSDRTQEYLGVCKSVLEAGPWTKGDYKEGTEQALHKVVAGYSRAMELLPPLEQLRRHFVPQDTPLTWLSQALRQGHRVIALCGLGGIGKSTTALAWCWKQVLGGTFPGQHGVLWASAAAPSGGVDGALATVVQTRLGMALSPTEATNPAVVRQRLQGWARHRTEPWLLVLDNVEPGCQERSLLGLLGDRGVALLTTRAGPKALHRDMDVVRAAALRLECLSPEDGYTLMLARWGGTKGTSLAASEEAALRELAGAEGLGGLPLAMEQAAALVSSVAGKTFVELLKELKESSGDKVLPGDDGGAGSLARTLTAAVTSCGLLGVAGLVDQLLQECESLDDVQWLEAKHIVWGAPGSDGTARAPSVVQREKFAALKKTCSEQSMSARHKHTVATVWAAQLSVLPKYCVEVLQGAAWFAPDHIPQSVFVRALTVWVEAAAAAGGGSDWVEKFAAGSALVGEVKRRLAGGEGSDVRAAVAEVVEAALQWLDDVSLVHRGVWSTAEDVHSQFGSAQFRSFRGAAGTSSSDGGATGGAGSGAGAGSSNDAQGDKARPWLSMHRLVQSVVTGSSGADGVAIGVHVLGSLRSVMADAVTRFKDVMKGAAAAGGDSLDDMELAAWLVAHDHAAACVSSVLPRVSVGSSEFMEAVALVSCVASLTELVVDLGLFRSAETWCSALKLGLAWLKEVGGGGDSSTMAHVLRCLGGLEHAMSRYDDAEPLLDEALAMYQRLHGDGDSSDVAKSLSSLGALCMDQSRYTEAEPLLLQALAMQKRLHDGVDSSAVALALDNLATLHWRCSRYGKAEDLVVQALAMVQRLANGRDSSDVANIVNSLALVYKDQSRYDQAEPLFVQALAMFQRLAGDSDNSDVARALNNLAALYDAQSRYDEAELLLVQALAMEQRLHGGSDSSAVARALNNLAGLFQAQSRFDDAEPLLVQALAMQQRLHGGSDSSNVAAALNNLAVLYQDQGRHGKAEPLLVQALAIRQRLHGGRDSDEVAISLTSTGACLAMQGRYSEAEPLLQQAVGMQERLAGGKDSAGVVGAAAWLAELYRRQSRFAEARPLIERALAMCERLHIEHSPTAESLRHLATRCKPPSNAKR